MNSASLCSMAGLYFNPIPTRFLAPIDCLKIPAQVSYKKNCVQMPYCEFLWGEIDTHSHLPGLGTSMHVNLNIEELNFKFYIANNLNFFVSVRSHRAHLAPWRNQVGLP